MPLLLEALLITALLAAPSQQSTYPTISFNDAWSHEIKPHKRDFPVQGLAGGFHQLGLTLLVNANGEVTDAHAAGQPDELQLWPQIEPQVRQWKFTPFKVDNQPATVQVEEYANLLPPERFPTSHVTPPSLRPGSHVVITLARSRCYGTCPDYRVSLSTDKGIVFVGNAFVAAKEEQTDRIDPQAVRDLAKRFLAADFYSMDSSYHAMVTDNPFYELSISIDGRTKKISDYVGPQVGMPAIIRDLEDEVDTVARTERWIKRATPTSSTN